MILGNIITSIIQPFANVFGWVLAAFYSFTHSYGLSIVMLTLAVMLVVFPLTRAGTRSMMRMQLLQPELLKIRNRHKMSPGMSAEERQAARLALNEEMMALYRENGVNPTGGCLPLFLQFPVFIVLYNVIRGMTHEVPINAHSKVLKLSPEYIPLHTQLYHAVVTSHGVLDSFGLNLANSVRSPGGLTSKIPYIGVILVAVVLQYISIWQITNRNPSASQTPQQMQMVQKFMPLIFVVIYIEFPAGVGVYFIVSSLFRIGQQEYMYKHDKLIVESVKKLRERHAADAKKPPAAGTQRRNGSAGGAPRSFRDRLRDAASSLQGGVAEEATPELVAGPTPATKATSSGSNAQPGNRPGRGPAGQNGKTGSASTPAKAAPQSQNRSRAKRRRKA